MYHRQALTRMNVLSFSIVSVALSAHMNKMLQFKASVTSSLGLLQTPSCSQLFNYLFILYLSISRQKDGLLPHIFSKFEWLQSSWWNFLGDLTSLVWRSEILPSNPIMRLLIAEDLKNIFKLNYLKQFWWFIWG